MSRIDRLTEQLLQDRARQAERYAERQQERQAERAAGSLPFNSNLERDPIGFDPHRVTSWRVLTGPEPGYLPKTPVRQGSVGFYIHCQGCNAWFESKGWAYCPTCMDLPAEERHGLKPSFVGRMCQAPGCENPIPHKARANARYCSPACQKRGARNVRDKPFWLGV